MYRLIDSLGSTHHKDTSQPSNMSIMILTSDLACFGVKIVATCQIYDSSLPNAHHVGIEYIITANDYNSLPSEEKPTWYTIDKKLATTVQGQFPELNAQQINAVLQHLLGNYGKVILTGIH
jgi:hypothetical protein